MHSVQYLRMENKEELKRKRSEYWSEEDKILLKNLIREKVKFIENKNTDTNNNQAKKKDWLEVQGSFNELCAGGTRNLAQLKTQWSATKVAARKDAAKQRKELLKTGGESKVPELENNSNHLSVWLPNEFVLDSNEFDSDFATEGLCVEVVEEATENMTLENDIIELDCNKIYGEEDTQKSINKTQLKIKLFK